MLVTFYDGSTLKCSEVEFFGDVIMFDHCRYARIDEIARIEKED